MPTSEMKDHQRLAIAIRDMFDFTAIPVSVVNYNEHTTGLVFHTIMRHRNDVSVLAGKIRIHGTTIVAASPFEPEEQTFDINSPESLPKIRQMVEQWHSQASKDLKTQCKIDQTIYARAYWAMLVVVMLLIISSVLYYRGVEWIFPLYMATISATLAIPSYFHAFGRIPRHRL